MGIATVAIAPASACAGSLGLGTLALGALLAWVLVPAAALETEAWSGTIDGFMSQSQSGFLPLWTTRPAPTLQTKRHQF